MSVRRCEAVAGRYDAVRANVVRAILRACRPAEAQRRVLGVAGIIVSVDLGAEQPPPVGVERRRAVAGLQRTRRPARGKPGSAFGRDAGLKTRLGKSEPTGLLRANHPSCRCTDNVHRLVGQFS